MRNQIGQWIPKGIAEGIESSEGAVRDAMMQLAEDTAGADIQRRMVLQANSIGGIVDPAAAVTGSDGGLLDKITEAIRAGMSEVELAMYMDGRKVGESVDKYLGNEITARRFAKT
jgi:hypothetical protein